GGPRPFACCRRRRGNHVLGSGRALRPNYCAWGGSRWLPRRTRSGRPGHSSGPPGDERPGVPPPGGLERPYHVACSPTGAGDLMIQLSEETRAGWRIVGVRGRADAESADELESALRGALEAHGRVAADLAGLDYISSAGLRALIQAARAAQSKGVDLAICAPTASVRKVF